MLRRLGGWVAVLALVGLLAPGLVEAQKKDADKGKDGTDNSVYVTDLGSAFQLEDFGRSYKSPESLVVAAGLLRVVSHAEFKELDATLEVTELDGDGELKKVTTLPKSLAKPNLGKQAESLIDSAELMATKQKKNLNALIKSIARPAPKGEVGTVYWYGRTIDKGQIHSIRLKVDDERTDLAFRATDALRITVLRDGKDQDVVAATLAAGGNLHFKPDVGTRNVRVRVGVKVSNHHHHHGHHHHGRNHKNANRRAVAVGDTGHPIVIRIQNLTGEKVPYTLFLN